MKICIVGLGYVGFPLFINLSKYYDTYGLDNDVKKVVQEQIELGIKPLNSLIKVILKDVMRFFKI